MKNKLKIFLCVLMIAVFCFGSTSVVYAKTGQPTDINKAWNIVKSYYNNDVESTWNSTYYFSDQYFVPVLLFSNNGKSYLLIDVQGQNNYSFDSSGNFGNLTCFKLYSFDDNNMYSQPTGVSRCTWSGTRFLPVPNLTLNSVSSGSTVILGSNYDILNVDGEKVFQKGTSQSPNPTPGTQPSVSASNILSDTFNNNSVKLSGVLQEIVTLLPILLPVLVSLIAIRKGIKFCLQKLRSA